MSSSGIPPISFKTGSLTALELTDQAPGTLSLPVQSRDCKGLPPCLSFCYDMEISPCLYSVLGSGSVSGALLEEGSPREELHSTIYTVLPHCHLQQLLHPSGGQVCLSAPPLSSPVMGTSASCSRLLEKGQHPSRVLKGLPDTAVEGRLGSPKPAWFTATTRNS